MKIRELQIINTNYIAVQNKLKTLQKTADDEGRNISKNEIENIKHFEDFKITSQEFKPTKQCAGGVFSKNLINPCVKIEGCPKLKAAPANCNAEWLGAPLGSEATVNGICKTPFKQNSAAPKRQCNVTLDADSKKVLTQTWGDCYIPCVQQ